MYCKNCGKQINDQMMFCPYCGTAQNHQQEPGKIEAAPQLPELDRSIQSLLLAGSIFSLILSFMPLHSLRFNHECSNGWFGRSGSSCLSKKYSIKRRDVMYILSISATAISIFWLLYILVA
jgi:hypothetical protein